MLTQDQLNKRRTAAQYIDSGREYAEEMAEINRLQEQLTPRKTATPRPNNGRPLKPAGMPVSEWLAIQCRDQLSDGKEKSPDVTKLLTALANAH